MISRCHLLFQGATGWPLPTWRSGAAAGSYWREEGGPSFSRGEARGATNGNIEQLRISSCIYVKCTAYPSTRRRNFAKLTKCHKRVLKASNLHFYKKYQYCKLCWYVTDKQVTRAEPATSELDPFSEICRDVWFLPLMYSSGGDSVDSAGPCEVLPSLPAPSWMGYIFAYGNGEAVLCESSLKFL